MIEQLVAALLASLGLFNQSPAGAERRCGWLSNPTPANYWLSDRDGEWTIKRRVDHTIMPTAEEWIAEIERRGLNTLED